MTKHARIQNDVAVDVVDGNPAEFFHADIAATFVPVPDAVERGWIHDPQADSWSAPADPGPQGPSYRTEVSRPEFKMLFTGAERIAIAAARAGGETAPEKLRKAVLDDFFDIIEDPALESIRLGHPTVQEGFAYLVSESLLTADRMAEISSGIEI